MPAPAPTTPSEYTPLPEEEFDYAADWKEAIDSTQPGGGDHVTSKEQEAVLVGYVPFAKAQSAEKFFLAHSWCDTGSPYELHRQPPCRHPRRPTLYAHSFSSVGLGPKGHAPDEGAGDATGGTWAESLYTGPTGDPLYYGEYEYALCTIRFKSYDRMRFLGDDYLAAYPTPRYAYEWLRNTRIEMGPATQVLQADGSSNLKFAEGTPGPQVGPPARDGLAFPAPIGELMARSNLKVTWTGVPHEYLSDNPYYLYAPKVIDRLGRINDADFLGLAKGCVLLLAAEFEPELQPLVPSDPDEPLTAWTVTFSFEHFDPEKGVPASEYRGHRIYPYRIDGKWYYCTRENGTSELLPLAAMYKIFQHVNDPS